MQEPKQINAEEEDKEQELTNTDEEEEEEEIRRPILYRDNPEWSDLTPLPLPQSENDPYYICYNEEYKDLFGYFFAIVQKDEISKRCIQICEQVISNYPGTYTAWSMKYKCLEKLGFDYEREENILNRIYDSNPKSYQLWYYKRWLSNHATEFHDQIPFLKMVFKEDSKNFHAWSYAIQYALKWKQEEKVFELATHMINRDVRNNSAWNVRLTLGEILNVPLSEEFEDVSNILKIAQKNEAAINFAFAIVKKEPSLLKELKLLGDFLVEKNPQNPHAWHILLFVESENNNVDEISKICDKLIETDPLRVNYYTLIKDGKIKFH